MGQSGRRGGQARDDPLIGRVVDGRYTVLSLLGRGGMGAVYRAHQASLERSVALKILTAGAATGRENEFQRRFFLEAASAAKLKHPNTITVFDYGSEIVEGRRVFFIAMELLEGQTLQQALARNNTIELSRALNVATQICRSLREAHAAGMVHRDLKPGNVMLVRQGDEGDADRDFVKVLDFGLVKSVDSEVKDSLTRVGTFLGSPRYTSPEQIEGRPLDGRADIYALGCLLFRMLAGRVPFDGQAPVEIMMKHLSESPPRLTDAQAPRLVQALVHDCLAKSADARIANMNEVIARLRLVRASLSDGEMYSVSDEHPRPAMPPPQPATPPPPRRPTEAVATPVPEVSGGSEPSVVTPIELHRRKRAPAGETALALDEELPARVFGRTVVKRGATATRRSILGLGLTLAAIVGGLWFAATRLQLAERLQALGIPETAADPTAPGATPPVAPVRIRLTSRPQATAFEVTPDGARRLGETPVLLDWNLREGQSREVRLSREGYRDARVPIAWTRGAPPPGELSFDVRLKRRRRRR